MRKSVAAPIRFWAKVEKTETCWIWTAKKVHNGYGQFWIEGRHRVAHHIAYEWLIGAIPTGAEIDHKCHNRSCVNPDHLRAVTHKQNQENQSGAMRNSKSGIRGVHWDASCKKWRAVVKHHGAAVQAGMYTDLSEAEAAVIAKRLELYTHNELDRVA